MSTQSNPEESTHQTALFAVRASEGFIEGLNEAGIDAINVITILSCCLCKYVVRNKRDAQSVINSLSLLMERYKKLEE